MTTKPLYQQQIELARAWLSEPPLREWIERPGPRGELVCEFALPLGLCPTSNLTRHGIRWMHSQRKEYAFIAMRTQLRLPLPFPLPLTGRPQVLAVRFSSRAPDTYSNFAKAAVDILCVPNGRSNRRLGIIREDNPKALDEKQWWEPVRRGHEGFVYLQVRR